MPNIKIRNLIPATGGDITSGNFIASALNTGEGHERVTRKVTYEQVVSGGAVFADFSEGLNVSGNPVITGFRTPTPDGGLAISGNNDILYIGSVEDDDNREVHFQYKGQDSIIIDSNNDVKIEKNLLVQDGEIRGKVGKFSEDLLVDGKKVLVSTPAPDGGIGFGGDAGDDDPVSFTQNGETRIKLESDGSISFNNTSNFKAGASFDPYITLAVQTDAPSSLTNKLYNKSGNLWWEGWQIAPAVDMTNGFSPEEDNTGNVGTSTAAWANGSFYNLSSKGTADISTLKAANLSVTQKIEYTAGSKALQGESSPTGADIAGVFPGAHPLNLYALNEPIFFGYNAFGNFVKKEKNGPWLKMTPPSTSYFTFNKLIHTKLSDGTTRIHMACLGPGTDGAIGRYSDDLGETWETGLSLSRSEYYGTGRNKQASGSFSNDIQYENDAIAIYNQPSSYNIKADYTIAEFAENAKNGDNSIAAKLMHAYLTRFYGNYQCHVGDNIFANSMTNPRDVISEENMKRFKFVVSDEFFNTTKHYGERGGGIVETRELNQRAMGNAESRHDIIGTFGNHYPGADNICVYAHGIKKILSALKNGETIDDAWFDAHDQNDFWMVVHSTHLGIPRPFEFSMDFSVGGSSNNDIIIISDKAMPASIASHPEEFLYSSLHGKSGRKSWTHGYGANAVVKYIDEDTLSILSHNAGGLYEIDTKALSNVLTVADGQTLDTGAAAACITKLKHYVNIGGVSTELAGSGGEASNPDETARNAITQYVHNHKDGYIVGIGNDGYAAIRSLAIDSYDTELAIWDNTTANGFTVPDFLGNYYYHPALKKLHFDLKKSYNISMPAISVDAQNNWGGPVVDSLPIVRRVKPVWGDSSENVYAGNSGHFEYISQYTNTGLVWPYRYNFGGFSTCMRAFSGHGLNHTPGSPRGGLHMTGIQFPDGAFMSTIYFRANGGTSTQNRPVNFYIDSIGVTLADGTRMGRAWSVSNPGFNGDTRVYGGTCYSINNQFLGNSNRTDKSTHPSNIGVYVLPYNSSTSTDIQAGADAWLEQTDDFFRIHGVYKTGQSGCYSFGRNSDIYNFEDDSTWDVSIISEAGTELPIGVTRTRVGDRVYLDFTAPDMSVYDFLSGLGLTDAEIDATSSKNANNDSQRQFHGWFQIANKARTEGYRKGFKMRDGKGSEWPDFIFNWESYNKLRSAGDLGFIFSDNSQAIRQMSNYDLVVNSQAGFKIVSIDGLKGENGLYIDDPTFFDHATKTQYFGKANITLSDYANNSLAGKPAWNQTALSQDKHIFRFDDHKKGIITTDGAGNLVDIQRIIPPAGISEEGTYEAFEGSGTLYYFCQNRLFYTDLQTVTSSTDPEISPVWEEIMVSETGLQIIFGFAYHPESDTTYLLGESGLYSKSVNGRTNWAIEIAPQLAFASQPNTGIYKDLNHDLHIVHKGDLSLSFDEKGIGTNKPFGFGTKDPNLNCNLTIRTQEDSTGSGDYKIVVLFEDSIGDTVGDISVDTEDNKVLVSDASDYRLKTNISNFEKPIERLMSLKPCSFEWRKNHNISEGFIAHEVQEIVPYAVRGTKDEVKTETKIIPAEYKEIKIKEEVVDETTNEVSLETVVKKIIVQEEKKVVFETPVYQGIDYSKIVPLLTAALQETVKEVQALKKKIDELENQ